jgi:hypothetical protein
MLGIAAHGYRAANTVKVAAAAFLFCCEEIRHGFPIA